MVMTKSCAPRAAVASAIAGLLIATLLHAQTKPAARTTATTGAAATTMTIRINAGAAKESTDAAGNTWLADTGFTGGETVDRGADLKIANTDTPEIYRTERFGMTAFAQPVPNGKYTVKLHFAETSSAVSAAGERIFSMDVEGEQLNDFDPWSKAGGRERAHVETVKVEVTDGQLDIKFTPKLQNPEINAIEIIPAS